MKKVNVTKEIQVPAAAAWAKISTFKGIEEYSPIERSITEGEGVGAKRTCYMPDDAAIFEKLSVLNNEGMHLQYEITEGPFPISGYVSDVHVKRTSDSSCEVSWGSTYDVAPEAEEEMHNLFEGFYHVIIDSLEGILKSAN